MSRRQSIRRMYPCRRWRYRHEHWVDSCLTSWRRGCWAPVRPSPASTRKSLSTDGRRRVVPTDCSARHRPGDRTSVLPGLTIRSQLQSRIPGRIQISGLPQGLPSRASPNAKAPWQSGSASARHCPCWHQYCSHTRLQCRRDRKASPIVPKRPAARHTKGPRTISRNSSWMSPCYVESLQTCERQASGLLPAPGARYVSSAGPQGKLRPMIAVKRLTAADCAAALGQSG
ncbi:hypothetical protein D9M70_412470 [compost metagenome]